VPPVPLGPRSDGSGDQAAHGRSGIRLQAPRQASIARHWKQAPTALLSRPAPTQPSTRPGVAGEADPAGRSRCPRHRATSHVLRAFGGEPPKPSAQAAELSHHEGDLPRKRSAVTGQTSRARLTAEANLHCRLRVPPGVATTRATVLEGALPVARCSCPCCRPLERTPATSRADRSSFATRGPFGSKAPCRWPGAAARRCDCKGEPLRSLAPAVRATSTRRSQCPEAPCRAECVSQHLDGRGKPPLPLAPAVRAARPEGRCARKHPA
jgi:hypothetical protein